MRNQNELLAELRLLCDQRDKLEHDAEALEKRRKSIVAEHTRLVGLVGKINPQIRACEKELLTGLTGFPLFDAAAPADQADAQEEPKPSRRTARTTH